jgi:hypothetical protein
MSPAQSPYEAVLGDRFEGLHPRLRAYFSAIPSGSSGVGEGLFAAVGTPRRWLRPFIGLLADPDVLFPVWELDVPFSIVNTPALDGGRPAVAAERMFRLAGGSRTMRDLIVATPEGLVDILGARRRFRALFAAEIVDGGLRLESTRVAVRIGSRHVVVPGFVAPRVRLIERFSEADELQHVEVTVSLPVLGKVYEYAGSFRYEPRAGRE